MPTDQSASPSNLCVLWDESHLWGLLCLHALKSLQIPFMLVRSKSIRRVLERYSPNALLVPGGWAKLKSQSLGSGGRDAIRNYVQTGGNYIGFCGGAGLALSGSDDIPGLRLCSWSRKSFRKRLPNFSGNVVARLNQNPSMKGASLPEEIQLPVWWPSQFAPKGNSEVTVLASYQSPGSQFWVADLNVGDLTEKELDKWEETYGINLQPDFLTGEPCIIEGRYGKGRYTLSYSHLETPQSLQANTLFQHLLETLAQIPVCSHQKVKQWNLNKTLHEGWEKTCLSHVRQSMEELLNLGQEHFLLFWRKSWLLGWRRGIPGSPINTLYALIFQATSMEPSPDVDSYWSEKDLSFQELFHEFHREMMRYLLEERLALARSPSAPDMSSSPDLQKKREHLLGKFPGYGGLYGELIHELDDLLYLLFCERGFCVG